MRVHHIVNSYSLIAGGAERVVRALHLGLGNTELESALLGIEQHGGEDLPTARSLGLRTPYGLPAFNGIRRYIREEVAEDDIVHAHLFPASLYVSLLKQLGCISGPTLLTEHSTHNRRRNSIVGSGIDGLLYRGFDRVVAISTGVRDELINWKPWLADKVSVVFNGIRLRHSSSRQHVLHEKPLVLSVGSLRAAKNYDNMLSAIALLADHDLEYMIAGEGRERQRLELLAVQLGIESRVKFLGHVEDVDPLLQRADVFLMASSWEGFGLAALEAMNASLPCVLSNVVGMRELAGQKGDAVQLVDPEDKHSIAQALRRLLDSNELRKELANLAFSESERFSEEQMLNAYQRIYKELRCT